MDDEDLALLFKPFGTVLNARLALDHRGVSLGIGVIRMSNVAEAELARIHVQGRGTTTRTKKKALLLTMFHESHG